MVILRKSLPITGTLQNIIFGIVLIFSIRGYAQIHTGSWNFKQVSTDSLTEITHLFFADSSAGYVGGTFTSDAISSYPVPRWFSTLDGGLSWSRITFNGLPASAGWFDISYGASTPSHNSVFLTADLTVSYIYYSLDNGVFWDSIRCNFNVFESFFMMFTEKEGLGIGGDINYPVILKTTDGGHSFPIQTGDSLFAKSISASDINGYSNAADFSDLLNGTYVVVDPNINGARGLTTLVTKNGGTSWEKFHADFPAFADDTLFGNIQYEKGTPNLWLMPFKDKLSNTDDYYRWRAYPNRFSFCFSSDYGVKWRYDTSFYRKCAAIYGVTPADEWMLLFQKNIESGGGDLGPTYTIVHSIDSGSTWDVDSATLEKTLGNFDARAIYFTDANHGWIATIHDGLPYVFTYQPVKNSVIEHGTVAITQLAVFPDPATNQVTINFPQGDIPLQAQIFDIVGRSYSTPCKIQNNTVLIDTHDLPNGIWLAIVKHTYGKNISRFILQK